MTLFHGVKKNDENIAIDGPNYLSVSSKKVTLYRDESSSGKIILSGTFTQKDIVFDFDPSSVNSGFVAGGNENGQDTWLMNDRFHIQVTGQSTNLTLTFMARKNYSPANPASNKDILLIRAGRITFEIDIEQINSKGWDNGGNEEVDF